MTIINSGIIIHNSNLELANIQQHDLYKQFRILKRSPSESNPREIYKIKITMHNTNNTTTLLTIL